MQSGIIILWRNYMSRDKVFEHYRKFCDDHMHLRDDAFFVLNAALKMLDDEEDSDKVFDKFDFGLRVVFEMDKKRLGQQKVHNE